MTPNIAIIGLADKDLALRLGAHCPVVTWDDHPAHRTAAAAAGLAVAPNLATACAGAGLVEITLNGKGEMRRIKIQKAVVDPDEVEVLEDLILAAFNDAKGKVEAQMADETNKLMGGLKLPPGMKLPF
jgi:DNA-binding YbaB/EbfC family protein